jgi:hypothetical protein
MGGSSPDVASGMPFAPDSRRTGTETQATCLQSRVRTGAGMEPSIPTTAEAWAGGPQENHSGAHRNSASVAAAEGMKRISDGVLAQSSGRACGSIRESVHPVQSVSTLRTNACHWESQQPQITEL